MKNIKEKLYMVGMLDVMSDIFYEVLEKDDNSFEVMTEFITDKELIETIRRKSRFSGDIIRDTYYDYLDKIKTELKKEILK